MRNDDMISRKALLEKFAHPPELMYTNVVMDEIRSAPTVGWWISVEDELPELGALALVYANSGQMAVARYIANNQWVLPVFFPTVTHWAPLPEAPKGDVDDDT